MSYYWIKVYNGIKPKFQETENKENLPHVFEMLEINCVGVDMFRKVANVYSSFL